MQATTFLIDTTWWLIQGKCLYDEAIDLKKDIDNLLMKNENKHHADYTETIFKVAIICFDCLALKKDFNAYGLQGGELRENQLYSAGYQTLACASKISMHLIKNEDLINTDIALRILAIFRRNGQAIGSVELAYGPTIALSTITSVDYLQEAIHTYFCNWYAKKAAIAAGIEYDLNYERIPEKHFENKIFKLFKCPITLEPIRYPVTAPNRQGGPDHHFERAAILEWLKKNNTNPVTNLELHIHELKENHDMREIIEAEMTRLGLK